jgi:hypothetical protein
MTRMLIKAMLGAAEVVAPLSANEYGGLACQAGEMRMWIPLRGSK